MELYLIRHAQSGNNASPGDQRTHDPPLTETGRRQAQRVAEWAGTVDIATLFTSPFLRTLETTEYIRKTVGLAPRIWVDLHEQGGCISGYDRESYSGEPGLTDDEIRRSFPTYEVPEGIDGNGWWKSKPFESPEQTQIRAERVAEKIKQDFAHTEETVACVSHGGFNRFLIGSLLGFPVTQNNWIGPIWNTGVTKLLVTPESVRLITFNTVGHLPDSMVT